ncbi:MAG: hypothetical protein ACM34H_00270, partial [Deltaproteobacteria bacterium]
EKVALTQGMPRAEKERILLEEVGKFKKLKEQVILMKGEKKEHTASGAVPTPPAPTPETEETREEESPSPEQAPTEIREGARFDPMPPHEAFAYALEEIKNVIQAEFRALRAEIKLWRESK